MEKEEKKRVEILGIDDKRQITVVLQQPKMEFFYLFKYFIKGKLQDAYQRSNFHRIG